MGLNTLSRLPIPPRLFFFYSFFCLKVKDRNVENGSCLAEQHTHNHTTLLLRQVHTRKIKQWRSSVAPMHRTGLSFPLTSARLLRFALIYLIVFFLLFVVSIQKVSRDRIEKEITPQRNILEKQAKMKSLDGRRGGEKHVAQNQKNEIGEAGKQSKCGFNEDARR